MVRINDETGEVVDENTVNYQLALNELNHLPVVDTWLEKKEAYLTAKEQFEMIDKPFREKLTELFEKYSIKSLKNAYIEIIQKNGYTRKSWDDKKLEAFIYKNGGDPADFKKEAWINGTMQIKYKE